MKALYIRFVLFLIGPAIRREIERIQECRDALVRACVVATERCMTDVVARTLAKKAGTDGAIAMPANDATEAVLPLVRGADDEWAIGINGAVVINDRAS